MGKNKHDLPTILAADNVEPVETSTPQPTEEELSKTITVSMPFFEWNVGYSRTKLDVRLNSSQAATLKGITLGLEQQEAKLLNGKCVANPVDALRWLLENAK